MNKSDFASEFRARTKKLAVRVVRLYQSLLMTYEARVIGKQLLRSATSVAANYRSVCRARSDAEFFSKLSIVVEEADEVLFWMELLIEAEIMNEVRMKEIYKEAEEILKVVSSSRKTFNSNQAKSLLTHSITH